MQSLHFAFAVGGSIAPLLVEAFVVESAVPNQTLSSRHVRSITESFDSSDTNNATVAGIIQAATQAPAFLINSTAENVTSIPTTTTLIPTTNLTTTVVNQTTLATEKPKKPKPSITNGGALGDSSQFESIPLKNEPVVPEPQVTTSTTSQAPETTSTTQTSTMLTAAQPALNVTTLPTNDSNAKVAKPANKLNSTSEFTGNSSKVPEAPLLSNQSISAVSDASPLSEKKQSKIDISSDSADNLTVNTQVSEVIHSDDDPKSSTTTQAPQDVNSSSGKKGWFKRLGLLLRS